MRRRSAARASSAAAPGYAVEILKAIFEPQGIAVDYQKQPWSRALVDLEAGTNDAAIGGTAGGVFSDNPKHWSGDHCVDTTLVPGVLFCNRKLAFDGTPGLIDIAPTILELFGVSKPAYMDGECLMTKSE